MKILALSVVDLKCQFSRRLRYTNSYVHKSYGIASTGHPPHVAGSEARFMTEAGNMNRLIQLGDICRCPRQQRKDESSNCKRCDRNIDTSRNKSAENRATEHSEPAR